MRRLVAWENVEELRGSCDREREEQPIRLGGRERCLGCGRSCLAIPRLEVRDAGEQMSLPAHPIPAKLTDDERRTLLAGTASR